MRPGEIIALQWKHAKSDHVEVEQRIYRGTLDRPKTTRPKRQVALSAETQIAFALWRTQTPNGGPEAWVFPSETLTTPVGRANLWRRSIKPKLDDVELSSATFQVMRRTHASLSRRVGIDPSSWLINSDMVSA